MSALCECQERTKATMVLGDFSEMLFITSCTRQIVHKVSPSCQQGKDRLYFFDSNAMEKFVETFMCLRKFGCERERRIKKETFWVWMGF